MLLDELAEDSKPARRGRGPSDIPDAEEIRQRRRMLRQGRDWAEYEESQDGDARAILDASPARIDQLLSPPPGAVGENMFRVERASREESTFFHPTLPPPNGPDGVPLFDE